MAGLDFFTIGQIVAPHGVRGDVRIYPDTDFPKRFLQMKYGYIDGKKYEVAAARLHKRVVLMKFVGVDDRNAAELLRGKELQVPREDLMPLKEGQHYIFDIIGMTIEPMSYRKLALSWGVIPVLSEEFNSMDVLFYHAKRAAIASGLVKKGDRIVITGGNPNGKSGNSNVINIEQI